MENVVRMAIAAAVAAAMGLLITKFGSYVPRTYRAVAVSICWALVYQYVL